MMKKKICILRILNEEGEYFLYGSLYFNVYKFLFIWENFNWYIIGSYYRYISKFNYEYQWMYSFF